MKSYTFIRSFAWRVLFFEGRWGGVRGGCPDVVTGVRPSVVVVTFIRSFAWRVFHSFWRGWNAVRCGGPDCGCGGCGCRGRPEPRAEPRRDPTSRLERLVDTQLLNPKARHREEETAAGRRDERRAARACDRACAARCARTPARISHARAMEAAPTRDRVRDDGRRRTRKQSDG